MAHHMRLPATAEEARQLRILRVAQDMRLRMDEKGWNDAYSERDTVIAGLLLLLEEKGNIVDIVKQVLAEQDDISSR